MKNEVMFKETVFIGSLNASIVHPSKSLIAVCRNAIVAHNHHSGHPEPRPEDIQVTKRLVEAGSIVGIEILDHLIIGNEKYISLNKKGYM